MERERLGSLSNVLKFLEVQIDKEHEIVGSIGKILEEITNPAVKATLKGISLDSAKHAEMYMAAMEILRGTSKALTQKEMDRLKEDLERHIRLEEELIERIEGIMREVEDEKVKLILEAVLADEKRHHKLLREVQESIVKGETITDEEWLDMIWKNVPFHGAPGG